jgi:antitoxin VapB
MAFHIKNPETDALARRVAKLKKTTLTAAVHEALKNELKREGEPSDFVRNVMEFGRRLREKGDPSKGLPIDKDFIDSLYE